MVKIGEVEFLVKFDTVGRQFKDAIRDAMKDVDFTSSDIEDRLAGIEGHLGVLVTPLSGIRSIDLIKAEGYFERLKDPIWLKTISEAIASSETLMKKFKMKEFVPGSEEAKKVAAEKAVLIAQQMAKTIEEAMASDPNYARMFSKLQNIFAFIQTSLEGGTNQWLAEKLFDLLFKETKIDEAVFKWLREQTDVNILEVQRIWDELIKDITQGGKDVVETYDDLMEFLGEKLKNLPEDKQKEILDMIFKGGPSRPEINALKPYVAEWMKDLTLLKGVAAPRVLIKALVESMEKEEREKLGKYKDITGKSFRVDFKALVGKVADIEAIVQRLGVHMPEQQRDEVIEILQAWAEKYGWAFLFGGSKISDTLRKYLEDESRFPQSMKKFYLRASIGGPIGADFLKEVATDVTVEKTFEKYQEELPTKIEEGMKSTIDAMDKMMGFIRTLPVDVAERIRDMVENLSSRGTYHG